MDTVGINKNQNREKFEKKIEVNFLYPFSGTGVNSGLNNLVQISKFSV